MEINVGGGVIFFLGDERRRGRGGRGAAARAWRGWRGRVEECRVGSSAPPTRRRARATEMRLGFAVDAVAAGLADWTGKAVAFDVSRERRAAASTHQIFSWPFLDLSSLTRELHTVHPPSYRYLSCQFSGWSSRFAAAATTETPRREIRILAARGAADLPRARPRGAARADTVGIVADAIVIGDANGNKPASRWTSRYASRRGSPSLS